MRYNIVFSGGSTKIPLHVGAYKAMEENSIGIESVWGNSCGSIIAATIAMGMDYNKLKDILFKVNFNDLVKQNWWEHLVNIFSFSGFTSGANLVNLFYDIFGSRKMKDVDIDLNIVGHSLNRRSYVIFNKKNYPNMPIPIALRISTAIPLFFTPYQYDGEWWVDGGVSKGFPIDLVEKPFIGHLIQTPNVFNPSKLTFKSMAFLILDQLMQQSSENSIRSSFVNGVQKDIIIEDPGNIVVRTSYSKPEYEFDTTNKEKVAMHDLGYANMKEALKCLQH